LICSRTLVTHSNVLLLSDIDGRLRLQAGYQLRCHRFVRIFFDWHSCVDRGLMYGIQLRLNRIIWVWFPSSHWDWGWSGRVEIPIEKLGKRL